jgi:hypothetical protein
MSSEIFIISILQEADLMFSLRHPNCVQLMGTCLAPPCLVTGALRTLCWAQRSGWWHALAAAPLALTACHGWRLLVGYLPGSRVTPWARLQDAMAAQQLQRPRLTCCGFAQAQSTTSP